MTTTDSALYSFLDDMARALTPPSRSPHHGMLDLSRNELVHPRAPALVAEALRAVPCAVPGRYPISGELIGQLAPVMGCTEEELEIFPGSDDAIGVLVDALCRGGRPLLLQDPNYPAYQFHADLRGVEVWPWLPRPGAMEYDPEDAVAAAARMPAGMMVATEPHGVLGARLGDPGLIALATSAQRHGHLLVVDECYRGFGPESPPDVLAGREHVLRVGSFSKRFGLAGLRLGYVIGDPVLVDYLRRWRRAAAVSGLTAAVAIEVLEHRAQAFAELRSEVAEGRDWLAPQLVGIDHSWRPLPSAANFLTVDVGGPERARELVAELARRRIAVRGHDRPVFSHLVQITASPVSVLERLVSALDELNDRREPEGT